MFKDIKLNIKSCSYVFKSSKIMYLYGLLKIIVTVSSYILKILLIERLIKLCGLLIENNSTDLHDVLMYIGVYTILITICVIYNTVYLYYIMRKYSSIFMTYMRKIMFQKVKEIDYESFDNPEFFDMYSKAIRDSVRRGFNIYNEFIQFISSILSVVALGTFIVLGDMFLLLIIVGCRVILTFLNYLQIKNNFKLNSDTESDRRMYNYVKRVFYQSRYAAEIKTTNVSELLIDECVNAQNNIDKLTKKVYTKNYKISAFSFVSNLVEKCGTYIYLGYKLFKGLTIEAFGASVVAVNDFSQNIAVIFEIFTGIKENALYISYFTSLMEYVPKLETTGKEKIQEKDFEQLEVKNLRFKYPNTDVYAIDDISIKVEKNEKLAIVGLNGAGKTTLAKLLLKFYNPDSGQILYNGQDIRNVKESDIRSKYAICFQNYQIYSVTIAENILMRKLKTKEDEELVLKVLDYVKMKDKILSFKDGIHTMCTREYRTDGAEFSGGELQRLVIARTLASKASIYILDEPTSNLDPIAEKNINDLIIEKAKDKAVILIAHRLSTVVDADRIILIEYGKIIEEGNHQKLMEQKGRYYQMFTTQANLYKTKA